MKCRHCGGRLLLVGRKDPPKVGPQKTVLEYRCEECGKYDYIYEHDNPSTQEPDDRPTIN